MNELNVLLDDSEIIVLDKPAGLPTANAARGVESLYEKLRRCGDAAAFIGVVSRLDQPVSGAVIFAKTRSAAACLAEQFRERQVTKEYIAVVEKRFPGPLGEWMIWQDAIYWMRPPGVPSSSRVVIAALRRGNKKRQATTLRPRSPVRGSRTAWVRYRWSNYNLRPVVGINCGPSWRPTAVQSSGTDSTGADCRFSAGEEIRLPSIPAGYRLSIH